VWAVLCASSALPYSLMEQRWERSVPEAIRHDRDLLLARMNRKEFSARYNDDHGDNQFSLPEALRDDKQVVVKLVEVWPEILLQDVLTPKMLGDQNVFRAMLKSDQVKNQPIYNWVKRQRWHETRGIFLSKFSVKIRANAMYMLEAAKVLDEDVLDHIGEPLLGNTNFATSLANTLKCIPPNALERFATVRFSKIASMAFVRKNGLSLRHVDKSLHSNEMVRTACKNHPAALSHCLTDRVSRALGRDKTFMRDIFSRLCPSEGDPALYQMLSMMNKLDYGLIAAAYGTNSLNISDLPRGLLNDPKFCKTVIAKEGSFWKELPDAYKADPVFAKCIKSFEDEEFAADVFTRCPDIRSDRTVWHAIIFDSVDIYCEIYELLEKFAPKEILDDKELMANACGCSLLVMSLMDAESLNEEFVVAAIEEKRNVVDESLLYEIPFNVQRLHPRIVVEELADGFEKDTPTDADAEEVAVDLWAENLDVARAWFDSGGEFHDLFPEELKDKESFGLIVACSKWHGPIFEDGTWDVHFTQFEEATSAALRSKKSFMLQAVNANRRAFFSIESEEIQKDTELVATACSGSLEESRNIIHKLLRGDDGNFEVLRNARAYAQAKVAAFDAFTKGFMPGMMANADPDCHPRLLVGDYETTLALKKRIGGFVGIAMSGQEAAIMRRAVRNLEWLSLNALRRDYNY